MRTPTTALLLAGLLVAGCSGGGSTAPSPPPDPARLRLAELAAKAAAASFDATYTFLARASAERGTIRLRQVPPQYRLDIDVGRTASYFALRTGIVSCAQRKAAKGYSCFLVARPGEPVPDLFDPGVQRLFRDAVDALAQHPEDYAVRAVSARPAAGTVPAGECFHVERRGTPPASPGAGDGFETGDYCFSADGIPTYYDVATGNLSLSRIGPVPTARAFRLPARAATLPSLRPTPSPTRS